MALRWGMQASNPLRPAHSFDPAQMRAFIFYSQSIRVVVLTEYKGQDAETTLSPTVRVASIDQACEGPGLGSMLRAIGGGQAVSFSHSLQGSLLNAPVSPLCFFVM